MIRIKGKDCDLFRYFPKGKYGNDFFRSINIQVTISFVKHMLMNMKDIPFLNKVNIQGDVSIYASYVLYQYTQM